MLFVVICSEQRMLSKHSRLMEQAYEIWYPHIEGLTNTFYDDKSVVSSMPLKTMINTWHKPKHCRMQSQSTAGCGAKPLQDAEPARIATVTIESLQYSVQAQAVEFNVT